MPNVAGLDPASTVLMSIRDGASRPYGKHARVSRSGERAILAKHDGTLLAAVEGESATVMLDRLSPVTVAAVNAFLADHGKVKAYWRTGEYRYKANGAPRRDAKRAPRRTTAAPKVEVPAPTAEVPAPVEAPVPPVAPVATPVPVIGSERRFRGKQPVIKRLTKGWTAVGEVLVPSDDATTLETAWRLREAGRPAAVLLTGPAGTAKTRLAQEFAFAKGVPFIKVDGPSIQTATDWYGQFIQQPNGSWVWTWSDLALAVIRGTPCVILIDELNRPETERALNGIMPLIDWTAQVQPVGAPHALRLPPGIMFMATLNEGVEYVGTVEVDAAVRDRFAWGVRMDYSSEAIEARILRAQAPGLDADVAKRLVRVAASQRAKRDDVSQYPSGNVLSTRTLIEIANAITIAGADPAAAIWAAVRARFTREDEPALRVLVESQFGPTAEPSSTLADDSELERLLSEAPGF